MTPVLRLSPLIIGLAVAILAVLQAHGSPTEKPRGCVAPVGWHCVRDADTAPVAPPPAPVTLAPPYMVIVPDGDPSILPPGAKVTLNPDGTESLTGGLILAPNSTARVSPIKKKD